MATTFLDTLVSAVDDGAPPARAAVAEWVRALPDTAVSAQELTLVRQRLLALRPSAAEQVDLLLEVVLDAALQHVTERAVDAALSDPVTGLPTRRLFERDCSRALAVAARTARPVSVVMIDVDGLKGVNDTRGHAAGDAHLAAVADALRLIAREGDGVYRIGGDEFAVLLADADRTAADRVISRFSGPSISWGVATSAEGGADGESLLASADARMYRSRQDHRRAADRPARRHGKAPALAAVAAAVAMLSTGALVTVTAGLTQRGPDTAAAGADPGTAAGERRAPREAPDRTPELPAEVPADLPAPVPAPAAIPSQELAVPVVALPVAVPHAPVLLPVTPGELPAAPAPELPQPAPDPGVVPTLVDDTVTLLGKTVCGLLC